MKFTLGLILYWIREHYTLHAVKERQHIQIKQITQKFWFVKYKLVWPMTFQRKDKNASLLCSFDFLKWLVVVFYWDNYWVHQVREPHEVADLTLTPIAHGHKYIVSATESSLCVIPGEKFITAPQASCSCMSVCNLDLTKCNNHISKIKLLEIIRFYTARQHFIVNTYDALRICLRTLVLR